MRRFHCLVGGLALTAAAAATAATPPEQAQTRSSFASQVRSLKSESAAKLGGHLQALASSGGTQARGLATQNAARRMPGLTLQDGHVGVSAYAKGDVNALRSELVAKGMIGAAIHGNAVTGRVPLAALSDMSTAQHLHFMRPAMAKTQVGLTTSQGDRATRSDLGRRLFGVDGRGVRVGVLSDSYDCLPGPLLPGNPFTTAADDIASNDLPRDVVVLKDLSTTRSPSCSDEGRAMMQLIHDVAPGAPLSFYTAFESAEDFAAGIVALADAGAKVIVDDIIYFAEPMFLDGPIAQAADLVKSRGIPYFSSAGNQARQSYESKFRASAVAGLNGGPLHDFDAGNPVDVSQGVTAQAGSVSLLSFQWDEPWASVTGVGSANDVDIYFLDEAGDPIPLCQFDPFALVCQFPGIDFNQGADAVEVPILINDSGADVRVQVAIELFAGTAPQLVKYVYFDLGASLFVVDEHDTQSGTAYGHANAAGAEAVGAAPWFNTSAFGPLQRGCRPACLELFSSAGGVPILFDTSGRRLAKPVTRVKPGFTAPDGGNTTFFFADLGGPVPGTSEPDGFPNFFGTSAAAPEAAAVAALMLHQRTRDIAARRHFIGPRELRPDAIYLAMRLASATQDIRQRAGRVTPATPIPRSNGFDFDSGFGFLNTPIALLLTAGF